MYYQKLPICEYPMFWLYALALIYENPWQFAMKPELGFLYQFAGSNAFKLSAKYNVGMGGELGTQGYITVSAGFAFGF